MALPTEPLTLTVQQIGDLSQHFSFFRHDVNNSVGLIGAAAELMRYSPNAAQRWSVTLVEQPPRIAGKTREFIAEAERILGIRPGDQPSWYRDMWSRSNAAPGEPTASVQLAPETMKALHLELLQFHKELTQLAFAVSGTDALAGRDAASASVLANVTAEQLAKVTKKFDQFATLFEKNLGVAASPHRLLTGVPSSPITLSADEVALFHRRLMNLEKDVHEHLGALVELSRLARSAPEQLQTRAGEFAPHAPEISGLLQKFGTEFDQTLGLARGK